MPDKILREVTKADIREWDNKQEQLVTDADLANYFKKAGAKEVSAELFNILKESKSQEDFYMKVLALMTALQEELSND